ncbi:MAG TPA: hypothetical protein VND93_00200 [Myxococcales bacterium]|nr:hypothetical protein [Myxococcales bacterium]
MLGLVVVPLFSHAAELTRVASSFDEGHPFGLFVELGFDRTQRRMAISREFHTGPQPDGSPGVLETSPQLRYAGVDYRLNLDLHAGLWHDVEFHYGIPLVFSQSEEWWLSGNQTAATSAVLNNCVNASGTLVNPSCPTTGAGAVPMFPGVSIASTNGQPQVFRGGFGNMRFGLRWAAFNQLRDDTKPTWVVGLEYEAPTADRLDPTEEASETKHGSIGDRIHKYQLWSAFSRKVGAIDPYVKVDFSIPYHGPGWYSNCDHPDSTRMAAPGNCTLTEWSRDTTGIQYPYTAEMIAGSEFTVFDQPAKKQRFTVDVRAHTRYVSPGRYYNELSGLTKKLMYTGDYIQVGGSVGLLANVADYLTLRARTTLSYETDHPLTNEALGQDFKCNSPNAVLGSCENGSVDYTSNPNELNPNFDYRMDLVARQFRAEAVFVFGVQLSASFNF